jgi:hypothetical protein
MASRPFTHLPIGVLTPVDPAEGERFRGIFDRQQGLAAGSERSIMRAVHVEHTQLMNDPVAIGSIVDLIRTVVDAVNTDAAAGADSGRP